MISLMEKFRTDYFNDVGKKYENHVNKFIEYLRSVDKLNTPTKIDLSDIDKCIGHYSSLGKINYRASMESHIESIKSFYDYLSETGKATDIFTQYNHEKFTNDLFAKYNLSEGTEREIFPMQTIIELLSALDEMLETNFDAIDGKRNQDKYIQRVILRLFIKLTLIAPAKKSVICGLKIKDFSSDFRNVNINKVNIKIPNGLRRDIISALNLTNRDGKKSTFENKRLFEYLSSSNFTNTSLNYWFCSFLKETDIIDVSEEKTTYELEPIMKTAIKTMLERMVNPVVVSKISGIKISSLETKYYENDSETINEAINWEIAKNEYYNYI